MRDLVLFIYQNTFTKNLALLNNFFILHTNAHQKKNILHVCHIPDII